jgi:hypothetical protein
MSKKSAAPVTAAAARKTVKAHVASPYSQRDRPGRPTPSRRSMRAFRVAVALATIAVIFYLMTHQVQAPSVYSDRPPTNGTSNHD